MGWLGGETYEGSRWRKELIDRGLAHFDSKTGEWKWKESPVSAGIDHFKELNESP